MVLPLFRQELETSCMAACVRMVLAALGHALDEHEIRVRCGHTKSGMRLNGVAGGLADLPVAVEHHVDWSLDDLREAVRNSAFPIVGVDLRPIEGLFAFHAVVIADIAGDQVIVHDPLHEQGPRAIGLRAFELAWQNADREAVLILARPAS
ncbi:MAG TPA: cysteine peptidase family C39 domain-containing protein [Blastocatellia bacterium]|nr:cysteine peptidase family C39 domain-containing protein [Blastocatellia bacterium]